MRLTRLQNTRARNRDSPATHRKPLKPLLASVLPMYPENTPSEVHAVIKGFRAERMRIVKPYREAARVGENRKVQN